MAQKKKTTLSSYQRTTRRISRVRTLKRKLRFVFRRGYYTAAVVILAVMVGAGWWWVQSGKLAIMWDGSKQALLAQTAKHGLALQYIYLEGRKHTTLEEVTLSLGLEAGDPILGLSVREISERIKKLGWVRDVVVERQLPDTLHIHIMERKPIALWQHEKKFFLVDGDGQVIGEANKKTEEYKSLLLVVGDEAPKHTAALMNLLSMEADLFGKVSSAVWVGNRRWNLRLQNDVEVKLPEQDADKAWHKLADMERAEQVLSKAIRSVDLRLADRIFIDIPSESLHKKPEVSLEGSRDT